MEIIEKRSPKGSSCSTAQTPLKLSRALAAAGAPIVGTTPDSIDIAEDRERFQKLVASLKLKQPANASARTEEQAVIMAREVGFPLWCVRATCSAVAPWRWCSTRTTCVNT